MVQPTLNVSYSTIVSVLTKLPSYYVTQGDGGYEILSIGDNVIRCIVLGEDEMNKLHFETNHIAQCTSAASADDALVLGMLANKIPMVTPRTSDGRIRMTSEKPSSTRTNFYSHDFCDKTTWYTNATRAVNEVATDSGDHLTYELAHQFVIDNYHGKITGEDTLKDASGNSYRVAVKVDGNIKTEQDPHYATGGDYLIDYSAGTVTFFSELDPAAVVTVTYHYATNSKFVVKPVGGKKLILELAEVQFSADVNPLDSVVFEARGIADYFVPPAYIGTAPGQIPSGTVISLQTFVYKAISDFHNDAFRSYPTYPALGSEGNWRSQTQPVTVFDWDYLSSTALESSKGMEIRIYLQHDQPFGGYMATTTFYCKSEDET
jgi:hypothetical protein